MGVAVLLKKGVMELQDVWCDFFNILIKLTDYNNLAVLKEYMQYGYKTKGTP